MYKADSLSRFFYIYQSGRVFAAVIVLVDYEVIQI